MSYTISCYNKSCGKSTCASNIIDLSESHTDNKFGKDGGMIKCTECGKTKAYILTNYKLQEGGHWTHYRRGVVRIPSWEPVYNPYVILTSEKLNGKIDGVIANYYKDTRPTGKLKHGSGPGGPPAFGRNEMMDLIEKITNSGFLSVKDLERLVKKLKHS